MRYDSTLLQPQYKICPNCNLPLKPRVFDTVSTVKSVLTENIKDSQHRWAAKSTVDKIYCCPKCTYCE